MEREFENKRKKISICIWLRGVIMSQWAHLAGVDSHGTSTAKRIPANLSKIK